MASSSSNSNSRKRKPPDEGDAPPAKRQLFIGSPDRAIEQQHPPSQQQEQQSDEEPSDKRQLRVLLPNGVALWIDVELQWTNARLLQELQQKKQASSSSARPVRWGNAWLEDALGSKINIESYHGEHVIVQDGQPAKHQDSELWNITPEIELLKRLPEGYTLETALADHVDNGLQAVWGNDVNERQLVSVEITADKITIFDTGKGMDASPEHSIAKWGTVGASTHHDMKHLGVGGNPPFLKPFLGRFGVGGVSAAFALGSEVVVSSKTKKSKKVATLRLRKGEIVKNETRVWRTCGELYDPTKEQLENSPHGSFTCVEISSLNPQFFFKGGAQQYWGLRQTRQMLKDIYSLYIQSDEANRIRTHVEFLVNGANLVEEEGGEIATCNKHSCPGKPFVVDLRFKKTNSRTNETSKKLTDDATVANARLTCLYYSRVRDIEALETVISELHKDKRRVSDTFETFPRVKVRWLGRLLPETRWALPPFTQPASRNDPSERWTRRVLIFADVDGGFKPRALKTELELGHPFTEALQKLGDPTGDVSVAIKHEEKTLDPDDLSAAFRSWVRKMHDDFDAEVQFGDGAMYVIGQDELKKTLKVEKNVVVFHKLLKDPSGNWKAGDRIKLTPGITGVNKQNFYGTIEWFYCDYEEVQGEVRMVCRPIALKETPSEIDTSGNCVFHLRNSKHFPITHLTSKNCERMTVQQWNNQLDRLKNKAPSHIDLFNEDEAAEAFKEKGMPTSGKTFEAGYYLPSKIFAVVRPMKGTGSTVKQGMICDLSSTNARMKLDILYRRDATQEATRLNTFVGTTTDVKGIYVFPMDKFRELNKAGLYEFGFSLVDEEYSNVKPATWRADISPLKIIERWVIDKSEPIVFRLDEELERDVSIQREDKYGNAIPFERLVEIKLSVVNESTQEVIGQVLTINRKLSDDKKSIVFKKIVVRGRSGGKLDSLHPSYKACLCAFLGQASTLDEAPCVVHPGKLEHLEVTYSSLSFTKTPDKSYTIVEPLELRQTIQEVRFQGRDRYQNKVCKETKVNVDLSGLSGTTSTEVDANGTLKLQNLKVLCHYNSKGQIAISAAEDGTLLASINFSTVSRSLRFSTNPPSKASLGSQVSGLVVELVDDQGNVDTKVGDGISVTMQVSWNTDVFFRFYEGKCKLPDIQMPSEKPCLWRGEMHPTFCESVSLSFEINVELADATTVVHAGQQDVVACCGQQFEVPFRAIDENKLPGKLTQSYTRKMDIKVVALDSRLSREKIVSRKIISDGLRNSIRLTLQGKEGVYSLLLVYEGALFPLLRWNVMLKAGTVRELLPVLENVSLALEDRLETLTVCKASTFPATKVFLVDSCLNVCSEGYNGKEMILKVLRGSSVCYEKLAHVTDGYGSFPAFNVQLDVGSYFVEVSADVDEIDPCIVTLNVNHGNYPCSLQLLTTDTIEVVLGEDAEQQLLPPVRVQVNSADGLKLRNAESPVLEIVDANSRLSIDEKRFFGRELDMEGLQAENMFEFHEVIPTPTKAGDYFLRFSLPEVSASYLKLQVFHGRLQHLKCHAVPDGVVAKIYDKYGNPSVSLSSGNIRGQLFTEGEHERELRLRLSSALVNSGEARISNLPFSGVSEGFYFLNVVYSEGVQDETLSALVKIWVIRGRASLAKELDSYIEGAATMKSRLQVSARKIKDLEAEQKSLQAKLCALGENQKLLRAKLSRNSNQQEQYNDVSVIADASEQIIRAEDIILDFNKIHREKEINEPMLITEYTKKNPSPEFLGFVVMLATVDTKRLSKVLADYIGDENLLAYICKSSEGYRMLVEVDENGEPDLGKGIFAFSAQENVKLGRFHAFCVDDFSSPVLVDNHSPQKLLLLPEPPSKGFLGFAVNLLHFQERYAHLRATVFYELYKESQVYDTKANMLKAIKEQGDLWKGGVSIDGGISKNKLLMTNGARDPLVCFATVPYDELKDCALLPTIRDAFKRLRENETLAEQSESCEKGIQEANARMEVTEKQLLSYKNLAEKIGEREKKYNEVFAERAPLLQKALSEQRPDDGEEVRVLVFQD